MIQLVYLGVEYMQYRREQLRMYVGTIHCLKKMQQPSNKPKKIFFRKKNTYTRG